MQRKVRIGVLISGRGSNLQALIVASQKNDYPGEIIIVGCNKLGANGLKWADSANIPYFIVQAKNKSDNEKIIRRKFKEAKVDLICLAGYMKILSAEFVNEWNGRILNIHPSLLPSFKGANAQKQALEAGVKITGCTVHFVVPEVDAGPIIAQSSCPVLENDHVTSLSERILFEEHKIYPEAVRKVANSILESKHD